MDDLNSLFKIMRKISSIRLLEFNDRLYMQKLAYLVQEIGGLNNHSFSWYVRGPYSYTLTDKLFYHDEHGTYDKVPRLEKHETATYQKVRELLGTKVHDPLTLELFASLWYLMQTANLSKNQKQYIIMVMCRAKPHFSEKQIVNALSKITQFRKKHSL